MRGLGAIGSASMGSLCDTSGSSSGVGVGNAGKLSSVPCWLLFQWSVDLKGREHHVRYIRNQCVKEMKTYPTHDAHPPNRERQYIPSHPWGAISYICLSVTSLSHAYTYIAISEPN